MRYLVIERGDYPRKHKDEYKRDLKLVEHVLKHHPETWDTYHGKKDGYFDIIEMEINEMHNKRANSPHHEYVRELIHVAAACINAHHAMTCEEDKYDF